MIKKTLKCLSLINSTLFAMANIFVATAGNTPSFGSGKSDMKRSHALPVMSTVTHPTTQNGCFLYPTDYTILKKYLRPERRSYRDTTDLPDDVKKNIEDLVTIGVRLLDMKTATNRSGTRELTFLRDIYSASDNAAIIAFTDKLFGSRTASSTASADTSAVITCRYPDFIIKAYTTIHSSNLLDCSKQLKALQMIFAGLKKQNRYMLDKSHTERFLELDPSQVQHLAVTLIREPVGSILRPGDFVILIKFPDISILYTIR